MATKIRPFNLHTDTESRIQTLAGNLIDSAYVNARVSTVDSAAVQVIIDSDYVKTTLKVGSTNTIFRYVSTANQTSFTGSDANSATLAYNPGAVQVFLNGSLLTPTVDFTTDSGDTITLVSGAALGSELVINTYKDGIITPTNALPIIGGELTGNLTMGDNKKIKLGNDSDAEIFHNATNTIINDKGTGDILLQVAGTTHFQTNATGVQVPDNKKLQLGTSNDLEIIHDGSNSIINDAGTGDLKLQLGGSDKVTVTSAGASITGTLGVTGAVTANAGVVVDNITIDGTEIDLSSGDLTLDVAGDIILDADGGDVNFQDGGTLYGFMAKSSDNLLIGNAISDGDVLIRGNDGGSNITAVTFDMSAAGTAIFNSQIQAPSGAVSAPTFAFSNDTNTGMSRPTSDALNFVTGGVERIRIDASGNAMVGTDNSLPGIGNTGQGISLRTSIGNASGIAASRADGISGYFNRNSDGDILSFGRSGTSIGTLGVRSGDATYIQSAANSRTGLDFAGAILPRYNGGLSNGTTALGAASYRYLDLYLSGGVFLGGTGGANKLDDYEQGTFTISLGGCATGGLDTTAYYTKIGQQVFFNWYSGAFDIANASGAATFGGLPFTSSNGSQQYGVFNYVHGTALTGTTGGYITKNTTYAYWVATDTTNSKTFINGASLYIMISGHYQTDA